ncbi:universal stress protein [Nocardioides fonticola]|uniref:Universal stress protein n=1 Tax=Nocardioides fonticola TaxID=450363 RepID=A0ABP7Y066_9ACTN
MDDVLATVVVGYLAKPEGEAALEAAIEETRRRGGRLLVLWATRETDGDVEALRARLAATGLPFDLHPPTGAEPADDLLAAAEANAASLLVFGLRRRSPVGKLILGSNAQRLLLDATCPVLTVTA